MLDNKWGTNELKNGMDARIVSFEGSTDILVIYLVIIESLSRICGTK